MTKPRRILVTSALPYVNGPAHLGHLLEYIQTDIWVRFQRMMGHECHFAWASDAHGTPIMIRARQEGIEPEDLIRRFHDEHHRDYVDFHIAFDNFHSTHSEENRVLVESIYAALKEGDYLDRRTIKQAYDESEGMFLPDRFVRGECPRCGAADQYGDSCESCGSTYAPSDLINPLSVLSSTPPVERESEHLYFKLSECEEMLRAWMKSGTLQDSVANKLSEWFEVGLRDWDITRDAPYFGFEIPDWPGKFFYVWLDAPVGYMASFKSLCDKRKDLDFDEWWESDSTTELYHFIGKDIIYFHALFWPAVLKAAGYRTPSGVFAHGFVTVNGEKMSKSRGTYIKARTFLEHLNPEYLRYYYAAKLGSGVEDIDLNLEDFIQKVNSDLIGKVINIASRCAGFVHRLTDGRLADELPEPSLHDACVTTGELVAAAYEQRQFASAMRHVMALADKANQYIDLHKPWAMAKEPGNEERIQSVCTQGLDAFRCLVIMLKPVLPVMAAKAEDFLACGELCWADIKGHLTGTTINRFSPLMTRVDPKAVEAMVENSKESLVTAESEKQTDEDPGNEEISIDDFKKIELRVATVIDAEMVEGADKLLRLTLDVGDHKRQVLSGIRTAYSPGDLIDRKVVVVANLK
ncbi:MAG: methionine--tRNA ligase, partial [Gammaproteobacteria bacterium]